jgi:hypothetical protein
MRLLPIWAEALVYCANNAIEKNLPGCLGYDAHTDEVTYHYTLTDTDRELFDMLLGTDEIWIITRSGVES